MNLFNIKNRDLIKDYKTNIESYIGFCTFKKPLPKNIDEYKEFIDRKYKKLNIYNDCSYNYNKSITNDKYNSILEKRMTKEKDNTIINHIIRIYKIIYNNIIIEKYSYKYIIKIILRDYTRYDINIIIIYNKLFKYLKKTYDYITDYDLMYYNAIGINKIYKNITIKFNKNNKLLYLI